MRIRYGIKGIFGLIVVFLFWLLILCFDIRFGIMPFFILLNKSLSPFYISEKSPTPDAPLSIS
jgi:hypothetical protein